MIDLNACFTVTFVLKGLKGDTVFGPIGDFGQIGPTGWPGIKGKFAFYKQGFNTNKNGSK